MTITQAHLHYIRSLEFDRRAERTCQRHANGEPMTFQQLADAWGLPLEAAVGGFQLHMARRGQVIVPVVMPSPIDPERLQAIADATFANATPKGSA